MDDDEVNNFFISNKIYKNKNHDEIINQTTLTNNIVNIDNDNDNKNGDNNINNTHFFLNIGQDLSLLNKKRNTQLPSHQNSMKDIEINDTNNYQDKNNNNANYSIFELLTNNINDDISLNDLNNISINYPISNVSINSNSYPQNNKTKKNENFSLHAFDKTRKKLKVEKIDFNNDKDENININISNIKNYLYNDKKNNDIYSLINIYENNKHFYDDNYNKIIYRYVDNFDQLKEYCKKRMEGFIKKYIPLNVIININGKTMNVSITQIRLYSKKIDFIINNDCLLKFFIEKKFQVKLKLSEIIKNIQYVTCKGEDQSLDKLFNYYTLKYYAFPGSFLSYHFDDRKIVIYEETYNLLPPINNKYKLT